MCGMITCSFTSHFRFTLGLEVRLLCVLSGAIWWSKSKREMGGGLEFAGRADKARALQRRRVHAREWFIMIDLGI